MKLIKLSQTQPETPEVAPLEPEITPEESEEIRNAISGIQQALASINKSIQIIEASGVAPLFQKDTLINMIQSGKIQSLDTNKVQNALDAMANIAKSSVTLNHNFSILNSNQINLQKLNLNYRELQDQAIKTLESGNFAQFEGIMANFNTSLQSQTGLT